MTDEKIVQEIRNNLRAAFPATVFQVSYSNGELDVSLIGGDKAKDKYPNRKDAVDAMEAVIRKTIPGFRVGFYE